MTKQLWTTTLWLSLALMAGPLAAQTPRYGTGPGPRISGAPANYYAQVAQAPGPALVGPTTRAGYPLTGAGSPTSGPGPAALATSPVYRNVAPLQSAAPSAAASYPTAVPFAPSSTLVPPPAMSGPVVEPAPSSEPRPASRNPFAFLRGGSKPAEQVARQPEGPTAPAGVPSYTLPGSAGGASSVPYLGPGSSTGPVVDPGPTATSVGSSYGMPSGSGTTTGGSMYGDGAYSGAGMYGGSVSAAPVTEGMNYDEAMASCDPGVAMPRWYTSLAGLYMQRDRPMNQIISIQSNGGGGFNTVITSQSADYDWRGGFEARIGRVLAPTLALETSFAYLDPFEDDVSVRSLANDLFTVSGVFNTSANPPNMQTIVDNARVHQLARQMDYLDLEINLVQSGFATAGPFGMSMLYGARWLRIDDGLTFRAAAAGTELYDNGGSTSCHYAINMVNHLVGFQVGSRAYWQPLSFLRFYASPKAGIYGTMIDETHHLCRDDGFHGFELQTSKDDVSFVGQLDFGATFDLGCGLSLFGGYRAIFISGIGLADHQIPGGFTNSENIAYVETNAELILHGAQMGVQWQF